MLEHSYQITLIYQKGQVFWRKPSIYGTPLFFKEISFEICKIFEKFMGIYVKIHEIYKDLLGFMKIYWNLQRFIGICKDLLGFVKIFEIYSESVRDL